MKYSVADWNKNFKDWNGFDDFGNAFIFLGNTYDIKDEIKQLGGKWNPAVGAWFINHCVEGYALMPVHIDDVYGKDYAGKYNKHLENIDSIQSLKKELEDYINNQARENAKARGLSYVGEIGRKELLSCRFIGVKQFDNYYGGYYSGVTFKYFFEDIKGNTLIWSTGKDIEIEDDAIIHIKCTIKDHKEYRGIPQTLITRCEVL